MYTAYYGLNERPFDLTPSSRFLYLGEIHKEALASLVYGITERKGFMLLTGDVGAGKTTMVHALLDRLDENVECVHLSYPLLSPEEFIQYIALSALGKTTSYGSRGKFLIDFNQFLKELRERQKTLLLIVDEAQALSLDLLEEIRLLSNIEEDEKKLINIILVGQPELKERLLNPRCKSLFQRISVNYHLKPLNQQSVGEYIRTRLRAAGAKDPDRIFPESVIKVIYRYSRGYPRTINNISDNVLLLGYVEEKKRITPEIVTEYCEDMRLSMAPRPQDQEVQETQKIKEPTTHLVSTHWKRFALIPILLIATLGLAIGLSRTDMIGRIADVMRTDVQKPAANAQEEDNEQGLTALDTATETTEDRIASDSSIEVTEGESDLEPEKGNASSRTVVVRDGDTLRELILEVYGRADDTILDMVMEKNPAIKDMNVIIVGEKIEFPPLPVLANKSD